MWGKLEHYFDEYPVRKIIAKTLLKYGLRVSDDLKIKAGDIEVPYTKIAKALDVDRRVVKETVTMILKVPELREVYTNLEPTVHMKYVGRHVGYGVIEIEPEPRAVGILAKVAQKIADRGINIVQVVAEDPELYPEATLTIITEKPIPGDLINELSKLEGVKRISIY
ncbi:MAG: ACT domain-containing protein [Thermococcus sp.]|uniref:Regulator n=1 Tax=Thermococcus guaymasensis DSM 11113 TaxID=1432656 RepID=A0A0X1KKY1_9EURY|nr:ACT domain-containing protein [Thermococcus guaymasensis]AJC71916.1 regulator [Thermococcus guaymasensis DSM 11113]MCD6524902.1 ACT domain-containing protein [Thermococcus sp.]